MNYESFRPTLVILNHMKPTLITRGVIHLECLLELTYNKIGMEQTENPEKNQHVEKRLHPIFDPLEEKSLKFMILRLVWERVEQRLGELDVLMNSKSGAYSKIEEELLNIKRILAWYENDAPQEVNKISDLIDIALSKLMEKSRIRILEVTPIES